MRAACALGMNVAVIFYSRYGDTAALAAAVAQGARQAGATVRLRRVADLTVIEDRWSAANERIRAARGHLASVPLAQQDDLFWADGIAIGSPARYGAMCAEIRRFLDGTRQPSGDLAGKVASVFCSPSAVEGAQRATLTATLGSLAGHGVLVQAPARAEMDPTSRAAQRDGPPRASADHAPAELDLAPARALGRRLARRESRTRG
ncbi:NAD(P)H-dependent oxidoreductase [Sorangium sp. So ce367]|uniref:NAD(P)H-dependent oxidoreductase n=1 Tax=Sorangium sp. So ce367 TaxID=3133305 RepID=UPI003F5EA512